MLILTCSSKLQLLEGMLRKSLPQTLTVHGAVMNINRGNPLGYEIVVDSWPDFKAVLARPRREIASDDSDIYANAYAGFYRDLEVYRDLVLNKNAVNWAQSCRIQGIQDGIYEVSRDAAAIKQVPLSATSYISYMHPDPYKIPERQLDPGFTLSSLNSSHADLLNEAWPYGGNKQSHRYLVNMLQYFPTMCLLDTQGQPVSWVIMDTFAAMGHGYTLPSFRGKGYIHVVQKALAIKIHAAGFPIYGHVAQDNVVMHKLQDRNGHQRLPGLYHICVHSEI
ncbi:glycine N-acyltransferase-like protein 3 isoform X1 [Pogona vitticeps]|nr:glycine N-acyltransferase-like protein 3 [Pogona vitticeps]XP_020661703.1 glycine N-acyltransferase-like protein 3 [Pogona vitticeps]XP_020661704.1 glycine N-acyltransferase-like protein 3 [Pogona vitticeps]XP_020661705.1 glycine N-acyltransferase-like protein 3 [Pogona vitticeps]XP_020661706.1 glycine N-acyltransferase-like protein 3 [Pogona vitticeps]